MKSTIPNIRPTTRFLHAIAATVSLSLLAAGCGGSSEPDTKPNETKPSAPAVVAVAGDGRVTLTWEDVEGADTYVVYFGTGELDAESANRIGSASSPQVIGDLENDTTYSFAVAGRNEAGEGAWSDTVVATPTAALLPPSSPAGVTATAADGQVTVSWSAVDGADAYELFWSDSSPIDRETATHVAKVTSPHVVTGLENDTSYYFAVIATNEAGESGLSKEVSATPKVAETVPQPPGNVVVIAGDGEVTVSWDPVESAASFDLLYTDAGELNEATATRLTDVVSPRTVSGLLNGTTYRFAVIARNAIGNSGLSEVVSATPEAPLHPPQPPGNVTAVAGDGEVTVSWDPVASVTTYDVVYTDAAELSAETVGAATRIVDVEAPFVVSGLTNGLAYRFAVIALNAAGESEVSEVVSATPEAPLHPPQPPGNVTAIAGDGEVTVSWDPVASATTYDVVYTDAAELSAETVGAATRIVDVEAPFVVSGLTNGTTYRFAVIALNAAGESEFSEVVSATPEAPLQPPQPPGNVTAIAGDAEVTVSWDPAASATSYDLLYTTENELPNANAMRMGFATSPFVVTGLTNGTTYRFAVVAVNAAGESELSSVVSATPLSPPPAKPDEIVLVAGNASIVVSWTSPPEADAIDLFYGTQSPLSEGNSTRVENVTAPHVLTGLTNDTTYYVRLQARNLGVTSGLSLELSATPEAPKPPSAPIDVQATSDDGTLTVSWSGDPFADAHDLYYGTETPITVANSARVDDVDSPYILDGLMNGVRYYVALVSRNEGGSSSFSEEASAIPLTIPDAPTGLKATAGFSQVTLNWSPPAFAATHTLYYRAGAEPVIGDPETVVVSSVGPPHLVNGLVNGTTYFFAVSASNVKGEGPVSSSVQAAPVELGPIVSGVFPIEGGLDETIPVTLKGRNFQGKITPRVYFGDIEATMVTVISDEEIQAVAPAAVASGWVPVRIANAQGVFVRELGFVYSPYPGVARTDIELEIQEPSRHVVTGDFNGDGAIDFATLSSAPNPSIAGRIEVVFGDGAGGVLDRTIIAPQTPQAGRALIAGDFDGDGHLDLAAAHSTFVQVHYGDGNGEFTSSQEVSGGYPWALAAGDLDGDGQVELIVTHNIFHTALGATILGASPDREWSPLMTLPLPVAGQPGVAVGHFNGDEDDLLDIAIYGHGDTSLSAQVTLFLQDDSEKVDGEPFGFREGPVFPMPRTTSPDFVVRDFNGDGLDDIAVATRELTFLEQRSDGSFNSVAYNLGNVIFRGLHAVDLDGDGLHDLVAVDSARSELTVLYASAPGVFEPPVGLAAPGPLWSGAVADFNGDGVPDLLAVGAPSGVTTAAWLLNDGTRRLGSTKEETRLDYVAEGRAALAGRILDGQDAVALIGGLATNSWVRLFGISHGTLSEPVSVRAGAYPSEADLGDFDGDSSPDIVLNSDTTAQITVVRNPGVSATVTDIETPGVVTALAAGDLDGDDYADLVLAIPSTNEIRIGLNDQNDGFTFSSVPVTASHVALGDFDSDGDLDVVYADGEGLGFLWNDGLTFTPSETTVQLGLTIRRVRTADIDDDGLVDLLVLTEGAEESDPDRLFVYRNNGDGTWTASDYEVGMEAMDCAVGDGDGDGVADIFVTNKESGTVSYFQGDGTGSFLPQLPIDTGGSPGGIALHTERRLDGRASLFVSGDHTRGFITAVRPR